MITLDTPPLLSELAQNHFREKSADTYENLIHAIEREGYSDPWEKFEMLRRIFEPKARNAENLNAENLNAENLNAENLNAENLNTENLNTEKNDKS